MDAPQLELFDDVSNAASVGRVVKTVHTDLGQFGNLIIVVVVDGSNVRVLSHLECADPKIEYYNHLS